MGESRLLTMRHPGALEQGREPASARGVGERQGGPVKHCPRGGGQRQERCRSTNSRSSELDALGLVPSRPHQVRISETRAGQRENVAREERTVSHQSPATPCHSSSLHSAPTRHPCLSGGQGGCRSGHTADSEWGDGRPDNQARRRLIHRAPVPPDQPWTGGRAPAKGPPSQRELSSP